MSASEMLAEHALSVRWEELEERTRAATRMFLLDTLTVGMAGVRAPFADAVREVAREPGEAVVVGRAERFAPSAAAFVNAFQIHAQEFDCVHEPAVVHPLATIVAALAAVGGGGDGAAFGAAMVAATDVAICLGLAARTPLKFFRPATAGIFGATVGVARLRGLDRGRIVAALGHALCFASGTMQAHGEGTAGLPLQIANAARAAVTAAALAEMGVPGAASSIEGPHGYLTLFEDAHDLPSALDELAGRRRIEELSHKPFPTGRAAHGAVVALRDALAPGEIGADEVRRLVYVAPPLIARLVGRPARAGMTPNYARLCLPYLLGVVLARGTVGLDDFSAERLGDAAVLRVAERVSVIADGNPDPAAFVPAVLEMTMASGGTRQVVVAAQYGSPAWPLDRAAREAKARACCAFAGFPGRADALIAATDALGPETDMGALLALTAGAG